MKLYAEKQGFVFRDPKNKTWRNISESLFKFGVEQNKKKIARIMQKYKR